MEWCIEYAAGMMLFLVTALLLELLFRKKWRDCDVYAPVAATMVDHILKFKRMHDSFYDRHQRFKTFRIAYPTFSMVCTTDPADIEHILRNNFANYVKAGPRVCLGKDFAYMQMKIVAASLIRFFKFEGIEGEEVTYSAALTLQMAGEGLNLRFKPRLDF